MQPERPDLILEKHGKGGKTPTWIGLLPRADQVNPLGGLTCCRALTHQGIEGVGAEFAICINDDHDWRRGASKMRETVIEREALAATLGIASFDDLGPGRPCCCRRCVRAVVGDDEDSVPGRHLPEDISHRGGDACFFIVGLDQDGNTAVDRRLVATGSR